MAQRNWTVGTELEPDMFVGSDVAKTSRHLKNEGERDRLIAENHGWVDGGHLNSFKFDPTNEAHLMGASQDYVVKVHRKFPKVDFGEMGQSGISQLMENDSSTDGVN
jgi:hypothetical protein